MMLTRIGIGVLIALALDPLVDTIERRLRVAPRRAPSSVSPSSCVGIAALVVAVLAPGPSPRSSSSREQFPDTVGELERLPLVGGWIGEQDLVDAPSGGSTSCPSSSPTSGSASRRGRCSAASSASPSSRSSPSPCSSTARTSPSGSAACSARSAGPQADEVGRVVYDTLGRYVGGSLTVAAMMGLFVLAARARPRRPAGAAGGGLGDDHRPHPAGRRRPRRRRVRRPGAHRERADGDHRRRPVRRST